MDLDLLLMLVFLKFEATNPLTSSLPTSPHSIGLFSVHSFKFEYVDSLKEIYDALKDGKMCVCVTCGVMWGVCAWKRGKGGGGGR